MEEKKRRIKGRLIENYKNGKKRINDGLGFDNYGHLYVDGRIQRSQVYCSM